MSAASSQLGMFRRDGPPETLGTPYVPMLLAKRGERIALEQLSDIARNRITPFVRIVPPELRGGDSGGAPRPELSRLAKAGGDRIIYLDAVGTPRRRARTAQLGPSYMQAVYDDAVAVSLAFAPVYPFMRPDLAATVRGFAAPRAGAAFLIRPNAGIRSGSSALKDDLRRDVDALGVDPVQLDAFVDLGYLQPGIDGAASAIWLVRETVAAIPWRSVTLAATSVPDSVAEEIADDSIDGILRREIALFATVSANVGETLRFADYAVQHPTPPASGAVRNMRASIRYTSGDYMFVSRGGRPLAEIDDTEAEYRRIAYRLHGHPPFSGHDCCWGDERIEGLADGSETARGQYYMRAIATCHHLTITGAARTAARGQPAAGSRPSHAGTARITKSQRQTGTRP